MIATAVRRSAYASGKAAAQFPKYQGGVSRTLTTFVGWGIGFTVFAGWPFAIQAYGQNDYRN